jgi:hypothetical protein
MTSIEMDSETSVPDTIPPVPLTTNTMSQSAEATLVEFQLDPLQSVSCCCFSFFSPGDCFGVPSFRFFKFFFRANYYRRPSDYVKNGKSAREILSKPLHNRNTIDMMFQSIMPKEIEQHSSKCTVSGAHICVAYTVLGSPSFWHL